MVADAVALLASIIGSVVTTAGRLAFKAASLGGPARAIYAANKARRLRFKYGDAMEDERQRVAKTGGGGGNVPQPCWFDRRIATPTDGSTGGAGSASGVSNERICKVGGGGAARSALPKPSPKSALGGGARPAPAQRPRCKSWLRAPACSRHSLGIGRRVTPPAITFHERRGIPVECNAVQLSTVATTEGASPALPTHPSLSVSPPPSPPATSVDCGRACGGVMAAVRAAEAAHGASTAKCARPPSPSAKAAANKQPAPPKPMSQPHSKLAPKPEPTPTPKQSSPKLWWRPQPTQRPGLGAPAPSKSRKGDGQRLLPPSAKRASVSKAASALSRGGSRRLGGVGRVRSMTTRQLRLEAAQLVAPGDGLGYGFMLQLRGDRDQDQDRSWDQPAGPAGPGGARDQDATFVPALRIGWTLPLMGVCRGAGSRGGPGIGGSRRVCHPRRFDVRYAISALPTATPLHEVTAARVLRSSATSTSLRGRSRGRVLPPPFARWLLPGVLVAWLLNSAILWGAWLGLLTVYHVRILLPAGNLEASSVDDSTWVAETLTAFALSALFNVFLVDAVKVAGLTLTSPPFLTAVGLLGAPSDKSRRSMPQELVRKLLRRTHKVLDVLT